jgi:hypothetical protein
MARADTPFSAWPTMSEIFSLKYSANFRANAQARETPEKTARRRPRLANLAGEQVIDKSQRGSRQHGEDY